MLPDFIRWRLLLARRRNDLLLSACSHLLDRAYKRIAVGQSEYHYDEGDQRAAEVLFSCMEARR